MQDDAVIAYGFLAVIVATRGSISDGAFSHVPNGVFTVEGYIFFNVLAGGNRSIFCFF